MSLFADAKGFKTKCQQHLKISSLGPLVENEPDKSLRWHRDCLGTELNNKHTKKFRHKYLQIKRCSDRQQTNYAMRMGGGEAFPHFHF